MSPSFPFSSGQARRRLLVVMRHAKAESFAPEDHRRRLTARGAQEARAAGQWLTAEGLLPTHAFVSSALRTRETWQQVAETTGVELVPVVDDALYTGGPDTALDILRGAPEEAEVVLYVGHNPTAASLAHLLDDGEAAPEAFRAMSAGFPTGALAVLEVQVAWAELDAATARLVAFHAGAR